jgi:hypothetical protein
MSIKEVIVRATADVVPASAADPVISHSTYADGLREAMRLVAEEADAIGRAAVDTEDLPPANATEILRRLNDRLAARLAAIRVASTSEQPVEDEA